MQRTQTRFPETASGFLFSTILVSLFLTGNFFISSQLSYEIPLMTFFLPVMTTSFFFGFMSGMFTVFLSIVGLFYFNSLRIISIRTGVFAGEGMFISLLGYYYHSSRVQLNLALETISESVASQEMANDKVRKLETDMARVWRLNTLGEMATGLAHELSQPISAIKNYSVAAENLLQKNTDSMVMSSLKGISSEAERASSFIHSLRSFIGSRHPEKSIEKINDVISDVHILSKCELNANGVKIEFNLTEPSLTVPVDRIQLIQVVLNLFRNSIESMSNYSTEDKKLFVGTTEHNNGVLMCVSDTGCGIPENESSKVYDAFYSTKKSGMGMGLAISRSIIEIHEGKIWNVPNEPKGTSFMIWLPNKVVF